MARERREKEERWEGEGEEGMSIPHEEVHSLLQLFVQCLREVGKKLLHCLHVSNLACTVQHYRRRKDTYRCAGRYTNLLVGYLLLSFPSLPPPPSFPLPSSPSLPSPSLPPPPFLPLPPYIVFCFLSAYLPPALPESLHNTDRQTDRQISVNRALPL